MENNPFRPVSELSNNDLNRELIIESGGVTLYGILVATSLGGIISIANSKLTVSFDQIDRWKYSEPHAENESFPQLGPEDLDPLAKATLGILYESLENIGPQNFGRLLMAIRAMLTERKTTAELDMMRHLAYGRHVEWSKVSSFLDWYSEAHEATQALITLGNMGKLKNEHLATILRNLADRLGGKPVESKPNASNENT